jgi:CxxC-x17-CxxC domain-containing protein
VEEFGLVGPQAPTERESSILATDMTLQCRDCGREFVFTVGEQEFYASRGLTHTPARCPECRAARKANAGGGYGGERAPRQMYVATCSACGGEARVPFQPRGDKPVYCSACFQQMGGGAHRVSSGGYNRSW